MEREKEICFVAMPFSEDDSVGRKKLELKDVYEEAIKPAVESEGLKLKCIRGDEIRSAGNILRDIVEYIWRAKLVIADLTGGNANVFYELGLAHSLSKKVIMIVQKIGDEMPTLPFDLANSRVIAYENTMKGGRQLKETIIETIKFIETTGQRPSNPVDDFLNSDDRTGPLALKKERDRIQVELRNTEQKLEEMSKELQRLRLEGAELNGMRQVIAPLLSGIAGGRQMSFTESLRELEDLIDKEGDLTVAIPPSSDNPTPGRKRIKFEKVTK